jgi:hypothetical protein
MKSGNDSRPPGAPPPPATERRTFPLHQGGDHAVNQEERHVGLAAQPRTTRCSAPISRRRRYATEPRPHSPGRSICRSGRIARGPLVRRLLAPPPRADRQTTSHGHALGRVFPQGVASSKTAPTDVLILAVTPPVFTTERMRARAPHHTSHGAGLRTPIPGPTAVLPAGQLSAWFLRQGPSGGGPGRGGPASTAEGMSAWSPRNRDITRLHCLVQCLHCPGSYRRWVSDNPRV